MLPTGDDHQSAKTSLTQRLRLEETLDRFESAWRNGPRPQLETFLAEARILRSDRLASELLKLDVLYRLRAGETPTEADYATLYAAFPGLVTAEFSPALPTPVTADNSITATSIRGGSQRPQEAAASSIVIGTQFGPYEILAKLGEGGMGAVYKARHQHLDKLVAIKVLPPQFTAVEESVARFKREMKAIGKIDHPHLVRAMDAGELEGTHYLAMEFVDGTDLAHAVKSKGKFSVTSACKTLRQAASALSAAHQAGLVHRDVKPSNLLLSKAGQIKLLDLGLARLGEDAALCTAVTVVGQAFGTPDFMAPEQWADSHTVDSRADLYALGCTLFFLLTGKPPYGNERYRHPLNKMAGHVSQPIPDLHAARPDVPAGVVDIYQRLMAKNPDDRIQTAAELIQLLTPFVSGQSPPDLAAVGSITPAKTQETFESESQRKQPNARLLAILGATLLAVLAGAAWILFPRSPAESVPRIASNQPNSQTNNSGASIPVPAVSPPADSDSDVPASLEPPIAAAPFNPDTARKHQAAWAAYLDVPVEYTNSIGMKFRLIPPGQYRRGSDEAQIAAALETAKQLDLQDVIPTERPQHVVHLPQAFYLGMYEVTQQEYKAVMAVNPSWFSAMSLGKDRIKNLKTDRHPVETVNWYHAVDFCNQLGKREQRAILYSATDQQQFRRGEGDGYRLPTEAEWEFACRAGTTTNYWSGDTPADLRRVAWYGPNSEARTHAVGTLPANPFGLYDMHGNVWEWMEDLFAPDAYQPFAEAPATDPRGPESLVNHVIRGGDWGYIDVSCRSASRKGEMPGTVGPSLGFRVVVTVEAVRQALSPESDPELEELSDEPDSPVLAGHHYRSPDWEWTEPISLGEEINQTGRESYPVLMGRERRMYFLRQDDFLVASRKTRDAAFSAPRSAVDPFKGSRPATGPLARFGRHEILSLSISEDGLVLAMSIRQPSRRRTRGTPEEAIWLARRDRVGEGFGNPIRLPDAVNAVHTVRAPWLSLDGLSLIVARAGNDSLGAADLYQHIRQSRDEEFGPAVHLGNVVNTSRDEISGTMSPDHLVLFRTARADERDHRGGVETVVCLRSSADSLFESAQPIDPKLQKYHPIAIQCSADGGRIYFHGSTDGDSEKTSLYMARRVLKQPGAGQ